MGILSPKIRSVKRDSLGDFLAWRTFLLGTGLRWNPANPSERARRIGFLNGVERCQIHTSKTVANFRRRLADCLTNRQTARRTVHQNAFLRGVLDGARELARFRAEGLTETRGWLEDICDWACAPVSHTKKGATK